MLPRITDISHFIMMLP